MPLIPAIVAVVLASSSRKKIAASGGRLTGESLCSAAAVVAWIQIGLFVLAAVVALAVLVLRAAA